MNTSIRQIVRFLTVTAVLLLSTQAYAIPNLQNLDPFFGGSKSRTFDLNQQTGTSSEYNFEGIIALSNCSASLVQFKNDTNKNKKALVLTNGHCMGKGSVSILGTKMPAMGEVLVDVPAVRSVKLFRAAPLTVASYETTRIVYGTMTDTDMAIYEINKTYQEIEDAVNIKPLILSDAKPTVGTPLEILSGYWRRGYSCFMDAEIYQMQEDQWIWKNSIKYSATGCETIGGTSGSPIINPNTREVIGVNNTGNDPGGVQCSMMNPCEIDEQGNITNDESRSYGQQTYQLYTCLNANFEIDLSVEGCELPK